MLETDQVTAAAVSRPAQWVRTGLRLLFGYLLAVAVGSILFVVLVHVAVGTKYRPDSTGLGLAPDLVMNVAFYFVTGALFGLPYTAAGTAAFLLWLPKSKPVFLVLGMFCPIAAALLTLAATGMLTYINGEFLSFMLLTFPAGLAAAYVYGAIGMGYGFGRWRSA